MARKQRYTPKQVAAALTKTHGMQFLAAKALGCSPDTIVNYIKRYALVREVAQSQRGQMVDTAENKLLQSIQKGEAWGITLCLKTLGKDRGYVERTEHTGKDGGAQEVDVHVTTARNVIAARLATIAARKAEGTSTNGQRHDLSG